MSHFYVFSLNAWGNEENNFSNLFYHQDRFQRAILRRKLCQRYFFCDFQHFYKGRNKKKNAFFSYFSTFFSSFWLLMIFLIFFKYAIVFSGKFYTGYRVLDIFLNDFFEVYIDLNQNNINNLLSELTPCCVMATSNQWGYTEAIFNSQDIKRHFKNFNLRCQWVIFDLQSRRYGHLNIIKNRRYANQSTADS